ncbi:uncharacterized protein ACLA_045120 [Aspergillus clavatus NRRL 1]|uniref:Sedlin n=1 Tax=Aspergillus clavatus (strain ATCC 1007 / CBS 513.65 / DSM 816 / NCTC 3887 / NRRL 1 / QM 1276 / 107) TaxID=344612 RepID=A1CGP2_ASPCL|nr:uncharacterized protein ACLA_045120 [Aspergillus clavatus NRRL 1]EAW10047.1 conserved hypothetical protein [Aspergillus clavatus NRRL 1]
MTGPRIACICVIGKADNPLHISLFPPYRSSTVDFSFLLNSCLDVFELRQKQTSVGQDLGLLHALDERLAAYGWLTTTGVKFLILVDLIGQSTNVEGEKVIVAMDALRESDLRPACSSLFAFRAMQNAYIQLLQNPFYSPDDHTPMNEILTPTSNPLQISNEKFIAEIERIGDSWALGMIAV